jgi:DNA-binding NtrC family response regulator
VIGAPREDPNVNQNRLFALTSTAFVLYLAVSVSASTGGMGWLDGVGFALSLGLALRPMFDRQVVGRDGARAEAALSAAAASMLAAFLAQAHTPLLSELSAATLLPALGVLVLELAVTCPDLPPRLLRHAHSLPSVRVLSGLVSAAAVLAALPPITIGQHALIANAWVADLPWMFVLASFLLSALLRVFRARLGSDARALAASAWAAFGITVSLLAALLVELSRLAEAPHALSVFSAAVCALSLSLGHAWLVQPRRAIVAGPWLREACALIAAALVVVPVAVWVSPSWPAHELSRWFGFGLFALSIEGTRRLGRRVVVRALSPDRGRLLDAVRKVRGSRDTVLNVSDLAARVLLPLRRAARLPEAAPLLYVLHDERELRLDGAGHPRVRPQPLPSALARHFRDHGMLPIVRDELSARVLRRPELRDVVEQLDRMDALVVVPLVVESQLEGALAVARGLRDDRVTLEELDALERMGSEVAGQLFVLLAAERAQVRAREAFEAAQAERQRAEDLADRLSLSEERTRLSEASVDRGGGHPEVSYSAAMRQLHSRLAELAPHPLPVLLSAESGIDVTRFARVLHDESALSAGPFLVFDALSAREPEGVSALLSDREDPRARGLLTRAEGGTLFVRDVAALDVPAQRVLVQVLSEHTIPSGSSPSKVPCNVRLVFSARTSLTELSSSGGLIAELSRWLEATNVRIPPLRERPEDLESLVLLSVDRVARALGRPTPGFSPDALAQLVSYAFPGNEQELENVVSRAVARASSQRIGLADLPALRAAAGLGSFVDQEREILRQALTRAGGNKTRAARALGLKRTTLIDKLKRHGLDDATGPTTH